MRKRFIGGGVIPSSTPESRMRGFASHLFFCLFCPVSELPSNKQKTMSFAPPAFRSAIWEMVGLPQSSISAPRKRDCGTPSVMLRIAQHSNPIFHPKFESLATARLFLLYPAVGTCSQTAGENKKDSGVATFKLWRCPRGERKGMGVTKQTLVCVVANPIFESLARLFLLYPVA